MHVSASISVSLYLYRGDFFFLLFLPAPSIKRTRTHFSPSSPSRVRHPCSTKTTLIVRFAFLFLAPGFPSSLFLRPTRLDTVGYTLTDSHAHSPAPPRLPSSPPYPPSSLSPSLAIVRARMPPISVDRQCIHASSPSLYREQRRTQIPRVCARERCGERSRKGSGLKGRQNRAGKRRREREREREGARTRT